MATAGFATDNKIGVNLTQPTVYSPSSPEYPSTNFAPGEVVSGRDGSKYIYAVCPAAVPLGGVVFFDVNWNANLLTTTNAGLTSGQTVGVASQTPFAAGNYGWFQVAGLCPAILVAASTAANSQLYSSATPGQLTSTASGNVAINGVVTTTVAGAAAGVVPGVLNNPEVLLTT